MIQRTVSPIDGSVVVERELASDAQLEAILSASSSAFSDWRRTDLGDRQSVVLAAVEHLLAQTDDAAEELTRMMGRPVRYTPGELRGYADRARTMVALASEALADLPAAERDGFVRFIRREPLGSVLVLSPWNYPYLCAVNAVIPALLSGNTVVLKHSDQTPLVAERMLKSFVDAGLPKDVFQVVHMSHESTANVIRDSRIGHVCFTGSVAGGHAVQRAAADRFVGLGLELGGKDPAYVRPDADLDHAIENLVDGAFFNSGQSCCAVERIYVHDDVYDRFVEGFVATTNNYELGDPLSADTTLGPVVRQRSADAIRAQVAQAVSKGAKALIDPSHFARDGGCYVAPQVLVDVTDDMDVMRHETFGPVIGIARVSSDEEAIRRMNDSEFGLTASVWTRDLDAALALGDALETGTVFQNRADVLDPELAWVGVKNSGRGATLSQVGFEQLTRPKSFHLRQV